jgi:hypothetical protein
MQMCCSFMTTVLPYGICSCKILLRYPSPFYWCNVQNDHSVFNFFVFMLRVLPILSSHYFCCPFRCTISSRTKSPSATHWGITSQSLRNESANHALEIHQVSKVQTDWTLTRTSHKDTEQRTMEASITLNGITLTD